MDAATSHSVEIDYIPSRVWPGNRHRLVVCGPFVEVDGRFGRAYREEEGLLDRIQKAVGGKNVVQLFVEYAYLSEKTLRYLFGAFQTLEKLIVNNMPYDCDDWAVLAAQQLRGKPLKMIVVSECRVGIAGTRALAELVEATPHLMEFSMYDIKKGLEWTREEALLLARLVETHTCERFWFGFGAPFPMEHAINRAMERAWYCQTGACLIIDESAEVRRRALADARNQLLALLLLPPSSADTPLARLLRRDGDHAILFRVLCFLFGGNVVFDATTVEEAYDACVLRVEGGVE